jgi:hypothetical protein
LFASAGTSCKIDLKVFNLTAQGLSPLMEYMRNNYGLDIRSLGRRQWLLAGEWVGGTYVDYVVNPELAKPVDD